MMAVDVLAEAERNCGVDYLFNNTEHHCLVSLSSIHLEQLLKVREELCTLLHFRVDLAKALLVCSNKNSVGLPYILNYIIPCNISVKHLTNLFRTQLWREQLRPQYGDY